MQFTDCNLNNNETIELGTDIKQKNLHYDGRLHRFTAITEGELKKYKIIKKKVEDTPTEITFPDGSVVLGLVSNEAVPRRGRVYYGVPFDAYDFDIEVSE